MKKKRGKNHGGKKKPGEESALWVKTNMGERGREAENTGRRKDKSVKNQRGRTKGERVT